MRPLARAAQISREGQGRAGRIEFRNEDILPAVRVRPLEIVQHRQIGRGGRADDVSVARFIHGHAPALISAAAAEVGRINEHWIDGQRLADIVSADREADLAVALEDELPADIVANAIDRLVEYRRLFDQLAAGGLEDQVTLAVELRAEGSLERHRDDAGIGPRRDHEIVFELAVVAVIDQIDALIHIPIRHFAVIGNIGVPLRGVVADQVIALIRQQIHPRHGRRGIGAGELHLHGVLRRGRRLAGRRLLQGQGAAGRRQEQRIAGAMRQVIDGGIGLSLVHLETQRRLAVSGAHLGLDGGVGRREPQTGDGCTAAGQRPIFEPFQSKSATLCGSSSATAFRQHWLLHLAVGSHNLSFLSQNSVWRRPAREEIPVRARRRGYR